MYAIRSYYDALEEDRQRCLDVGMNDYLRKPMRMEDLEKVLDTYYLSKIS